jgi:hypothetical protein
VTRGSRQQSNRFLHWSSSRNLFALLVSDPIRNKRARNFYRDVDDEQGDDGGDDEEGDDLGEDEEGDGDPTTDDELGEAVTDDVLQNDDDAETTIAPTRPRPTRVPQATRVPRPLDIASAPVTIFEEEIIIHVEVEVSEKPNQQQGKIEVGVRDAETPNKVNSAAAQGEDVGRKRKHKRGKQIAQAQQQQQQQQDAAATQKQGNGVSDVFAK